MKGTSQRATSTEAAGQMQLKVPTLNLLLLPAASNSQTCFRGPFQNYEQRKTLFNKTLKIMLIFLLLREHFPNRFIQNILDYKSSNL